MKAVVTAAAKMRKADINSIQDDKKFYPTFQSITSKTENKPFIPDSLQVFLTMMLPGKNNDVKLTSLGQALVQGCRPKGLLAQLQIGLGVQLHHQFGSRYLLDLLNSMWFTASYSEVQRFEASAAAAMDTSIPSYFPGKFLQFVADNVDYKTQTLDGHGTFYGMGIIACTTPGSNVRLPIPRARITMDRSATVNHDHL